jgi:hypothetical protein
MYYIVTRNGEYYIVHKNQLRKNEYTHYGPDEYEWCEQWIRLINLYEGK